MERKKENTLLGCTLFAFFCSGTASQPLGSFIPFLRQTYGFSYDFAGILLSCQSIGNLVSILIAGVLPVYLGRRRSILVTAVWMLVAYSIFAAGVGVPLWLAVACFMTGVARGGNSNFANTMVSTLSGAKATWGYNLLHGCFAVGALLSPLALLLCVRLWPEWGWRRMAVGLCLLCLCQLVVYLRMPLPEEHREKSIRGVDWSFLRNRQFWLGSSMLFFYISMEYAIVGWLVTYFQDTGILSENTAQSMNSLLWLVIFLGRMAGAFLSGRIPRSRLLVADGVGVFLFFLLMFFSRSVLPITVGLMGVGFFMATIYPSAFSLGSECVRGNDLGCSILTLSGSAGGILTPMLVGFVAKAMGIRAGMGLIMACTGMMLLSILVSVRMTVPQKKGV